jgi:hypothetical protein
MNVDIISMSWIINKDDPKLTDTILGELNQGLTDAANKGVLMFCAANDEGVENANRQAYPAAAIPGKVFKIGAAAATGVNAQTVNRAAVDYLFPGAGLKESSPYLVFPAEMSLAGMDGSSSATALASGLAALLLYFLSNDKKRRWNVTKSRRHDKIDALLKHAASTDQKYVQVWELFGSLIDNHWDEMDDENVLQTFIESLITKAGV